MKISQIIQETSTTSGSVAPVEHGFVKMQTRNPGVYGGKKVGNLLKGKKTNKPFANSVNESAEISETDLSEQDLIVVPGQGRSLRTGFVKHDPDRAEHEGQTLKNSLHTIIRVATHLDKELSVRDNFPEWVSEKVGATKSMMVNIMNYLISAKEMQTDPDAMESLGTTGAMTNGEMGESQLDELSPKALGSYVKSASGDMAKRTGDTQFQKGARVATSAFTSKQPASRFEKDAKIEKRQDGINRAVNKITSKN